MKLIYLGVATFLLLNLFAGMFRALNGPTAADRLLAVQLFGTLAVAILLLLAQAFSDPALFDVALIFGLLSAVTAIVFVRQAWPSEPKHGDH